MQITAIDQNFLKKNVKSILLLYVEAEKKKKKHDGRRNSRGTKSWGSQQRSLGIKVVLPKLCTCFLEPFKNRNR